METSSSFSKYCPEFLIKNIQAHIPKSLDDANDEALINGLLKLTPHSPTIIVDHHDESLHIIQYSNYIHELLTMLNNRPSAGDQTSTTSMEQELINLTSFIPKINANEAKSYPHFYLSRILMDNFETMYCFTINYSNLNVTSHLTKYLVKLIYSLQFWELYHLIDSVNHLKSFLITIGFEITDTTLGHLIRPPKNYLEKNMYQGFQYPFPYPFYNYSYHKLGDNIPEKYAKISIKPYIDITLKNIEITKSKRRKVRKDKNKKRNLTEIMETEELPIKRQTVESNVPQQIAQDQPEAGQAQSKNQPDKQNVDQSHTQAQPQEQYQYQIQYPYPYPMQNQPIYPYPQYNFPPQPQPQYGPPSLAPSYPESRSYSESQVPQSTEKRDISRSMSTSELNQPSDKISEVQRAQQYQIQQIQFFQQQYQSQSDNQELQPNNPSGITQGNLPDYIHRQNFPFPPPQMYPQPYPVLDIRGNPVMMDPVTQRPLPYQINPGQHIPGQGPIQVQELPPPPPPPPIPTSETKPPVRSANEVSEKLRESSNKDANPMIKVNGREVDDKEKFEYDRSQTPSDQGIMGYLSDEDGNSSDEDTNTNDNIEGNIEDKPKNRVVHQCHATDPISLAPCNKIFYGKNELLRHQEFVHATRKRIYKCVYCAQYNSKVQSYPRHDSLARHIRRKHQISGKENKLAVSYAKENVEIIEDPSKLTHTQLLEIATRPLPHPPFLTSDFILKANLTGFLQFNTKEKSKDDEDKNDVGKDNNSPSEIGVSRSQSTSQQQSPQKQTIAIEPNKSIHANPPPSAHQYGPTMPPAPGPSQAANQTSGQPANQPANQTANQTANQPANQTTNQNPSQSAVIMPYQYGQPYVIPPPQFMPLPPGMYQSPIMSFANNYYPYDNKPPSQPSLPSSQPSHQPPSQSSQPTQPPQAPQPPVTNNQSPNHNET